MTAQGGDGPADLTRLTVNLSPKAASALEESTLRTGDSRTDTVNIALMLYAQIGAIASQHEGAYWSEYPHFDERGSVWLLIARGAAEAAVAAVVMHVFEMVALGAIALYVGVCALAVGWLLAALAVERLRRPAPVEEIVAVAEEGLSAAPDLADDEEATARTVAMVERIRAEAAADAAGAAFVTPGRRLADAFLAELFPRSKDAPKEQT